MRSDLLKSVIRTCLLFSLLLTVSTSFAQGQLNWTPPQEGYPQTSAEMNGFQTYTNHLEMWEFLDDLRGLSFDMRLSSYGVTHEGREIPYAIFSRPLVSEPWEAWALGRPIVLLAANIHGGERTFREGLLVLMREFATRGTPANDLLDQITVIAVPQINPDGFELTEDGERGNFWGIDLNRDYVKLEQPELVAYVGKIMAAWRPHLFVDSHNGGSPPYNLAYQCPSHYDPAREITLVCDQEIFPAIDARLEAEGLRSWYYPRGTEEAWGSGSYQARIGRNYGGMINSIGILFEAPRQEREAGARAGYLGNLAVAEYAASHAEQIMQIVTDARMETIAMGAEPRGEIAVEMEYGPEDYTVDYSIVTGIGRNVPPGTPVDTIDVTGAQHIKKPIATKTRPRPWAYVIPRDAVDAIALLRRHDITVEMMIEGDSLDVTAYTVAGVTHERAYNHAAATRVEVGEVLSVRHYFPKGTYVVPTAQFLGRLVGHMLEPETDDNVIYWNTMDAWLPRPRDTSQQTPPTDQYGRPRGPQGPPLVPIFKLMTPTQLTTRLVEDNY